jgi:hypothetical protein
VGSFSAIDPTDEEPDTDTLIEVWNGASWTVVSSPSPGTGGEGALLSVACGSPRSCVAVGSFSPVNNPYKPVAQTLVESWDGTSWSVVSSPGPGERSVLRSITCTSPVSCVAVGSYGTPGDPGHRQSLVETWDGTSWATARSPTPANDSTELASVACTSRAWCLAVGKDSTMGNPAGSRRLVESWDGTAWSVATGSKLRIENWARRGLHA